MPSGYEEGVVAIVPFKSLNRGKGRLAPFLRGEERKRLSLIMLEGLLKLLVKMGLGRIVVVSPDYDVLERLSSYLPIERLLEEKEEGVNAAIAKAQRTFCEGASASLVLPADLPLIEERDIRALLKAWDGAKGCVVLSPSRSYDGTNALLRSPPDAIGTYYDQDSFALHLEETRKRGLRLCLVMTRGLLLDLDTKEDVEELLSLPAGGEAQKYLKALWEDRGRFGSR